MLQSKIYPPLKFLSYAVLALMGTAILYAFYIAVLNWPGIGV